ncbi:MAG TPA: hypothetical protein VGC62_26890 [Pseudomonas sp.]|uniref:DUF7683 domain-containing protein n=1 Tax=Pseudomonas sp. TaxID=306 RepID=UPI002EDAE8F2
MIHFITGYSSENDFPVFRQDLVISLARLKEIMRWEDDGECVFSYKLNGEQIKEVEIAALVELPKALELYLDCEED